MSDTVRAVCPHDCPDCCSLLVERDQDRILRVARTIADLEGADSIRADHIADAIQYRTYELRA